MEKNLYHLSPDERRRLGIEQLPETLGEAIELTSESELVLRTLGEHIFNRYVEIKRQEWEDYRVQVTPVGARALPRDPVISSWPAAAPVSEPLAFTSETPNCDSALVMRVPASVEPG